VNGIASARWLHLRQLPLLKIGIDWLPLLLNGLAALLWLFSLRLIDVRAMNDLGLISALPLSFIVALVLLTLAFVSALLQTGRRAEGMRFCSLLLIILMLHGTPALIYEQPRFAVTWLHAGFTDYVQRTGQLATLIDARFSWPGFFTLMAFFNKVAGLDSLLVYANLAPLVFAVLYSGALWIIAQAFSSDKRIAWLALWFFHLTNWIGQDYISPQGLNLFFYMFMLAVLLAFFKRHMPATAWPIWARRPRFAAFVRWGIDTLRTIDPPNWSSSAAQRIGLLASLVVIFAASASSHQLTPIAATLALLGMIIWNRFTPRLLPVLFGIIVAIWISYFTLDYLIGHSGELTGNVGQVGGSVAANVTARINGSAQHQVVVNLRLIMTLAIWLLAGLGVLRRWILEKRLELTFGLLIVAPFSVIALNSYGGESLLRVYLFALPFTTTLAAALFFPNLQTASHRVRRVILGGVLFGLSGLLLLGFFFTRYGNERMDFYTHKEIAALNYVYDHATPGTHLILLAPNTAARHRALESVVMPDFGEDRPRTDPAKIDELMHTDPGVPHYLLVSRAQIAFGELFIGLPHGWAEPILQALVKDYGFQVVFENEDAQVYIAPTVAS
jgi:hypothetical protein